MSVLRSSNPILTYKDIKQAAGNHHGFAVATYWQVFASFHPSSCISLCIRSQQTMLHQHTVNYPILEDKSSGRLNRSRPDDGGSTSETSVNFNVTTRRYIQEDEIST
jgi:hypothetical protein